MLEKHGETFPRRRQRLVPARLLRATTAAGGVARNPRGPHTPFHPLEPTEKKRVHRGGSFLCTDQYCTRYMVGTRGKGEISTGSNHLGFRCVKGSGSCCLDRP